MNAVLHTLGIDAVQFRALTRTYLVMDLRRSGGARKKGVAASADAAALPLAGLLIGALFNSISIALLVVIIQDTLTAAVLMVAMSALTTSMLLLVDFTGSVVSPDDYWVVAPRPVSSRTYFAARITAVLVYLGAFSFFMSLAPALVFFAWHRLGVGAFAGAILATVLATTATTSTIIGIYTFLLAHLAPARLIRALSWVHLAASMVALSGFLLVVKGFEDARVRNFSIGDFDWIWWLPATWFGAIVPALAGAGSSREMLAGVGAVAVTLVLLSISCGRVDLEFAARLAEARMASPVRRRMIDRLPGFSAGEAYAVATLVRAQFRNDLRFRLAVLGVIPMMLFYLFLGWSDEALVDPFVGHPKSGGAPIYMGIAFLPMILHGALQFSDQWRASWIFFASPADPAKLVVASKNFVALFVMGVYLALMATFWAFFYERVWHAVVHALFVGALAHLLLQAAVLVSPQLPFAREPRHAEQSGRLIGLFTVGMIVTAVGPHILPFVYQSATATIVLGVVLAAVTIGLEAILHRRARAHVYGLEFS